jgi:hypothetical protein
MYHHHHHPYPTKGVGTVFHNVIKIAHWLLLLRELLFLPDVNPP